MRYLASYQPTLRSCVRPFLLSFLRVAAWTEALTYSEAPTSIAHHFLCVTVTPHLCFDIARRIQCRLLYDFATDYVFIPNCFAAIVPHYPAVTICDTYFSCVPIHSYSSLTLLASLPRHVSRAVYSHALYSAGVLLIYITPRIWGDIYV